MPQIQICPSCHSETARLVYSPLFDGEVCAEICAPVPADLLWFGLQRSEEQSGEHGVAQVVKAIG